MPPLTAPERRHLRLVVSDEIRARRRRQYVSRLRWTVLLLGDDGCALIADQILRREGLRVVRETKCVG